mgnify:CR=1 FL=1
MGDCQRHVGREPAQIADITVPGAYKSRARDMLIDAGYRALLSVPLLREEQIIGSLSKGYRQRTGLADARLRFSVLLKGAPAATAQQLAAQQPRIVIDRQEARRVAERHMHDGR